MRWVLGIGLLLALGVLACNPAEQRSELFDNIFKPEAGGLFRGAQLGMPLDSIKRLESIPPDHDDRWGYVYEYNLGEGRRYFLEYICKNPQVRTLSSIVANIFLKDEGETTEFYNEVEAYLRGRYGVADGNFGDLRWKNDEAGVFVTLRILDDKKSLSLNYVPASGF